MHTYNGYSCTIHYNSDLSGNVTITGLGGHPQIEILAQDLLDFVAHYVRKENITKIERQTTSQILGISRKDL